jgi:hypothetical protein
MGSLQIHSGLKEAATKDGVRSGDQPVLNCLIAELRKSEGELAVTFLSTIPIIGPQQRMAW